MQWFKNISIAIGIGQRFLVLSVNVINIARQHQPYRQYCPRYRLIL